MTSDDTKPADAGKDTEAAADPAQAAPESDSANDGPTTDKAAGADEGQKKGSDSVWAKSADAESADADGAPPADEAADLKRRLLLAHADMENLRKRTEREVEDARRYAVSNFAREMLTVSDNLQRALDAVPDELREGDDKAATALVEGVEATARLLEQAMQKFDVTRIEAAGAKFDPAMHQAMMEVDDADAEPGTVAAEIQTGYAIGGRVLRPAFVSVVKKRKVKVEVKRGDGETTSDESANASSDSPAG